MTRVRAYLNDGHEVGRGRDNYISIGEEPLTLRIEKDQDNEGVVGRLKINANGIYWFPKGAELHSMNPRYLLTWEQLDRIAKS